MKIVMKEVGYAGRLIFLVFYKVNDEENKKTLSGVWNLKVFSEIVSPLDEKSFYKKLIRFYILVEEKGTYRTQLKDSWFGWS